MKKHLTKWSRPSVQAPERLRPRPAARARRPYQPRLDVLEERLAPAVTLSISNPAPFPEGDGGTANMVFTITRAGDLPAAVQVDYATQNGTAVAGVDYQAASGTLYFAPNQTTATIAVPVIGNRLFQSNRTFTVALASPMPSAAFAPQQTFAGGPRPYSAAVADFNNDGRPDLAAANGTVIGGTVSVLLNTTAAGAMTPSFAARQAFSAGSSPFAVATGDFNNDSRPDLAIANFDSGTVSVLLSTTAPGASLPTFAPQQQFTVGVRPRSLAVADFNRDGRLDVVTGHDSGFIAVLRNTTAPGATTPGFAAAQTFNAGPYPVSLAVLDFDGDNDPDLAATNQLANTVSVLLNWTLPGSTTFTFRWPESFSVGGQPFSVAAGDLNGDGRPDLAAANSTSGTVSVLLNTTPPGVQTPGFAPQWTFPAGSPFSVAMGDFNGDGRPDLATSNYESGTASVLLNTTAPGAASARFAPAQTFASASNPRSVVVGDFNTDGRPDLAVSHNNPAGALAVLLNARVPLTVASSFAPQLTFATPRPTSMAVGDLNGDGKLDLAVANPPSSTVLVLLNTTAPGATTASFAPPQAFATDPSPDSVALGDLNNDGKLDLAVITGPSPGRVAVLLNTTAAGTATPSFAPPQTFTVDVQTTSVAVGDFNGDGRPDLAVFHATIPIQLSVFLNTTPAGASTLSFTPRRTFTAGSWLYSAVVADVNRDGRPDLVAANRDAGTVSVLLNTTPPGSMTASFAPHQTFAAGGSQSRAVTVGDLNGDGRPDLAVANGNAGTVSVLLNTTVPGAATASFAPQQAFAIGTQAFSVAMGDVNGDGRLDLAVGSTAPPPSIARVSVLLNTTPAGAATASFAPSQSFVTGGPAEAVALADFNGDGKPDLAAASWPNNAVSVLLNNAAPITLASSPATGTIQDDDAPAAIAVAAGNNQRGRVGTAFAAALAVEVRNAAGSLVEGVSVTFTAPAAPGGTFPGGAAAVTVPTNASGRATAPALTADTVAGGYNVTARATGGGNPSTSFSLTNTPGPVTYYYVYPGSELSTRVTQGVPLDIYILPLDAYYNWITDYAGQIGFYTPDAQGAVPPPYTFTGTEGGLGVPGPVTFGTLGMQELYVYDTATFTVWGYAAYEVVGRGAPGGAPSPSFDPGTLDLLFALPEHKRASGSR